jgi:hypothetical protein
MSQIDVATGLEDELLEHLDGISGGPVFRVVAKPIVRLELLGIVSQGSLVFGHHVGSAARLDVIDTDGRIVGGVATE